METYQSHEPRNFGRRDFLKLTAGFAGSLATGNALFAQSDDLSAMPLGLVDHAMRGMRWNTEQLIEYAASLKLDTILFNTINRFESLEKSYLTGLKNKAATHGMRIYFGIGSVSENSPGYRDNFGPPAQLIKEGIRVASLLDCPVVNVRIGNIDDRYTDGGIKARIEESVKALRAARNRALDAGIKFGFENHAGDLRSEELIELIEAVGTDVCGFMLDPGNAVWALEDPMKQVQMVGKYTVCTSIRDYMVWPVEDGAIFQWTAVGSGLMDVKEYVGHLAKTSPGVPICVETISNSPRPLPFLTEEFMAGFPDLHAKDMIDFLKLLRHGHPLPFEEPTPGEDQRVFDQKHQRYEFERSIAYLRKRCGVGKKVNI